MSTTECRMVSQICSLLSIAVLCFAGGASAQQTAQSYGDTVVLAGSPRGEVTRGVLMRPQGKNRLQLVAIDRRVSRFRMEQSDYAVPRYGRNPNRVFADGDPYRLSQTTFDLSGVGSVTFTVTVRGNRRVPRAIRLRWVR